SIKMCGGHTANRFRQNRPAKQSHNRRLKSMIGSPIQIPSTRMGPGRNPMTDSPGEPDWSLLPHDPVRFFGLAEGFDRRELKRSYNQLIRRFKPEKHPQEFQRIRAAYEQLDSGIRYG